MQPRETTAVPDRERRDLRYQLGAIPRGRGRRIPAALRERIMAWTVEQRSRSAAWCELSRALGVPTQTLKRWATPRPEHARRVSLRPVAVIDEPPRRTLTVVAPSGLRIEGLTVADVLRLLQGLS